MICGAGRVVWKEVTHQMSQAQSMSWSIGGNQAFAIGPAVKLGTRIAGLEYRCNVLFLTSSNSPPPQKRCTLEYCVLTAGHYWRTYLYAMYQVLSATTG